MASAAHLAALEDRPAIRATLDHPHLSDLLAEMIASDDDLDRLVADVEDADGDAPVSTDDNLYLEYATPKGNVLEYQSSLAAMLGLLNRYRTFDPGAKHLGP